MIENLSSLKFQNEKRTYQLLLSPDSPLGEVFDVLCQMRSHVLELINKNAEMEKENGKMDSESSS